MEGYGIGEVENKIFAAVDKQVKDRESTLKWALQKAKGKTICIIYVYVPAQMIPIPNGMEAPVSATRDIDLRACQYQERQSIIKIMDDCLLICDKYGHFGPFSWGMAICERKQLAYMALKCCYTNRDNRPDLASEVWNVLKPMKAPRRSLSSPLQRVSEDKVPTYFLCPIFQEIMQDPHFAADRFTYEADALRGWFEGGHTTSPMTNLKLANCNLTPNRALRSAIQEWLQLHQCV